MLAGRPLRDRVSARHQIFAHAKFRWPRNGDRQRPQRRLGSRLVETRRALKFLLSPQVLRRGSNDLRLSLLLRPTRDSLQLDCRARRAASRAPLGLRKLRQLWLTLAPARTQSRRLLPRADSIRAGRNWRDPDSRDAHPEPDSIEAPAQLLF